MELKKSIQSIKDIKKFKDKKPDWRDIIDSIDAARFAPMAGNNYSLKFIIVDDKDKIQKITDSTQQSFISQASYVVVVCSDPTRTMNAYKEKGEIYLRQQAGAAIQNFLLKLKEVGLSTCWIRLFVEEQIKRELNIPEKINVEAIFPIGYEHPRAYPKKENIELDRILYFNKYGNKKMKNPKELNV
ncbi:nitroreductase family protein [Candidatus Pacearchaeota archaeon]|jgi:nitroreductase|nr:nitroreductase family protein [Candidatus Pacearchaeota archaeon]|tara:strand:+ start:16192 stop:16749 length:558 start_codon:yes stop_codon:yes gene_type:complete